MSLAAEESAKCKAAKEVIKSLTAQVMFGSSSLTYNCHFCYLVMFTSACPPTSNKTKSEIKETRFVVDLSIFFHVPA